MIFKTALETFEYINTLLEKGIKISPKAIEKICALNKVNILQSTYIQGENKKPQLHSVQMLDSEEFILVYKLESWIHSLPSLYHDNEFLERFLFGFEEEDLQTQRVLDEMSELFNPSNTQFVDWLASWVGVAFSKEVDERAKRRVLHNIVQLYKIRGTKRYFVELIKYLCDINIRIDDSPVSQHIHHSLTKYSSDKKNFIVFIDDEKEQGMKKNIALMKMILQKEKPIGVSFRMFNESPESFSDAVISTSIDLHSEDSNYDYDDYESWE